MNMLSRSSSLATQRAHLERSRPSRFLANEGEGVTSPSVRNCLSLIDLVALVGKIGKSKGNAFKVKQGSTGSFVQTSALGHQLLEVLVSLDHALTATSEVSFDPRINLMVAAARERGLPTRSVEHVKDMLLRDPWGTANVLNGFMDEMRFNVNSRSFMHQLQRHKDKYATRLRDQLTYFKRVATLHPDATVMRLELHSYQNAFHSPRFVQNIVADLHLASQEWLRQATSAYGEIIVANSWKLDFDNSEGFFAHVVLVVDGPQPSELPLMERSLMESWCAIAGPGSSAQSCKGPAIELEYRGRRTGAWNGSLDDELRDAAIFLVNTDALVAWEYDGKTPANGRGPTPQPGAAKQRGGGLGAIQDKQPPDVSSIR
jgi:hypothetical protein